MFIYVLCIPLQAKDYNFRHYKVEDGLSSNTVRAIIQDHNGFMWFGTEDGLNRFDGYSFKVFRSVLGDTTSLGNNYVYSLMEDQDHKLWIGTEEGVYIYDYESERFSFFNRQTSDGTFINSNVQQIVEDEPYIWFGTLGQNIFRYNKKTDLLEQYVPYKEATKTPDYICQIFKDRRNIIWAATSQKQSRISHFNPEKNQFALFKVANPLPKDLSIHRLFEDSQQNFWLGTWEGGLCKLERQTGKLEQFTLPKQNNISHIHSIAEPESGKLFIGSDDGLVSFDLQTENFSVIEISGQEEHGLSDKFVYPIFKDREGGIWIGTYYGGLNYLSPNGNLFERYVHSDYVNSIGGNVIGKFCEDKDGNLWIASDDGGLNHFNTKTGYFTVYSEEEGRKSGLPYHNVHALCIDDDKLWVGTYSKGLYVMDIPTGQFKSYTSEPENVKSLDGNSIYSVYKDRENHLWIGSTSGINRYNYKEDCFIREKAVNAGTIDMVEDMYGYIWFATWGKGLLCFHDQSKVWSNYLYNARDKTSLPNNQVNCVCIDGKYRLWIGTGNGLCQYNYTSGNFIRTPLNLKSNLICDIIADGENLWLTTTKGLIRFNPDSKEYKIFTKSDGLQSDQLNVKSGIKTSDGKIYVGTANGFNAFYPQNLTENKYIPPVVITNLQIFNKDVNIHSGNVLKKAIDQTSDITLSYKQTVFSLEFVALSYSKPEKNRYAFKLEGFDKDWNYVENQRKATYTNLPAGKYIFKVKASNNDGVWNETGARITIVIKPPFWFSKGFIALYGLLFAASLIYIIRYFNRRTKKKHEEELHRLSVEKEKEVYNARISFFTLIAHEIRTPVSLIIGPLEKIMTEMKTFPEKIKDDLNIIARNSQHLLFLVNQLLDFQKAEQNTIKISLSEQNIYELLENIKDRFKPSLDQQNIRIRLISDNRNFTALVDPEVIIKSVSNLLSNASKYTKDSIEINLQTKNRNNKTFAISVTDNGHGIAPEEQELIFKPFYQVSGKSKPGTGIGLSLVKTLIEAHQGKINMVSIPDQATTFSLILPIEQSGNLNPEKQISDNLVKQEKPLPGNKNVHAVNKDDKPVLLVIEDNKDMCAFLYNNFSGHYQVLLAENGVDGLRIMKSNEVSIIISDLMMPEMDGITFCTHVKKDILTSHIPVILLTAKTDTISKIDAMKCGADDYIEKPFSIEYLEARIENLLESRKTLRSKFSEMPFIPLNSIAPNKADEEFLLKMNGIIEAHISDPSFSIDQLADELYISRSGLFAKIKTLTDITPNGLIQLIRLKKAAELLTQNRYRINEICYLVGFDNPSYFAKCFHKQFGILPKDFMNQPKKA